MRFAIPVAVRPLDRLCLASVTRGAMLIDTLAVSGLVGAENAPAGGANVKADGAVDVLHRRIGMMNSQGHESARRSRRHKGGNRHRCRRASDPTHIHCLTLSIGTDVPTQEEHFHVGIVPSARIPTNP